MNERLTKDNTYTPDIIITLLAILVMSCFYHGMRVLIICAISALCCYAFELAALKVMDKKMAFHDYSAVITGVIIGLMMPATVKYSVLIVTSFVAIIIAKHIFGGSGHEIFNPAAVAYVFAALCWPNHVLMYPITTTDLPLSNYIEVELTESFSSAFNNGTVMGDVDLEVLLGYFDGPIACTQILVIFVCVLVLLMRRSVSISAFLGFVGTFMAISTITPAIAEMSIGNYIFYELSSNMLVFAALFIVADYRFLPAGSLNRFIMGVVTACFTLIFRRIGEVENPVMFAVLITSPFVDVVDNYRMRFIAFIRGDADDKNKLSSLFEMISAAFIWMANIVVDTVKKLIAIIVNPIKSNATKTNEIAKQSDNEKNETEASDEE